MRMQPTLINGGKHKDERGELQFNNDFDATKVKRIYTIENVDTSFVRAWQGHSIETRWFSALKGRFQIKLIQIDNWEQPNPNSKVLSFEVTDEGLDILYVPPGYISSIQSLEEGAKLLAMADYQLGEVNDEYRFDRNYFTS